MIVTEPDVEGAEYVTEHELEEEVAEDTVHVELGPKLPPLPPSLHVIVPMGLDAVPAVVSVTVTV